MREKGASGGWGSVVNASPRPGEEVDLGVYLGEPYKPPVLDVTYSYEAAEAATRHVKEHTGKIYLFAWRFGLMQPLVARVKGLAHVTGGGGVVWQVEEIGENDAPFVRRVLGASVRWTRRVL